MDVLKEKHTEKKENENIIIKRYMRFCTQHTTISQDEECAQSQQILLLFPLRTSTQNPSTARSDEHHHHHHKRAKRREKNTQKKKSRNVQFLQETTAAWKWILSLHETDSSISRPSSFRVSFNSTPTKLLTLFISSARYDWITWKTTTEKEKRASENSFVKWAKTRVTDETTQTLSRATTR